MKQEELLYNVIFPEDNDPNYVNYGYFIGRSKKSVDRLKAIISESQLNPILISDDNKENAFFVKIFQSEVDRFLEIVNELKFKQITINSCHMDEIRYMFEEFIKHTRKKGEKSHKYLLPQKFNRGKRNWELPDIIKFNPTDENKPKLKGVINL